LTTHVFYATGTATPRRIEVVAELRSLGINVVWCNIMTHGVFGSDLDAHIGGAKIVLSLLAFDDEGEWKITRLGRLLSNERFVIAEYQEDADEGSKTGNGSYEASERQYFSQGAVFAPRSKLAATITYYLERPEERRAVAKEGERLFKRRTMGEALRGASLI